MKINHIWIPLPDNCLVCSAPASEAGQRPRLCRACEEELPWQPPGCACCAIVLTEDDGQRQCVKCLRDPPEFDSCHVLFEYCPPVQDLIAAFKYRQRFAAGRMMAGLLAESFLRHYKAAPPPQLLIPVPMHPRRLRRRGFNQALELARHISRLSGIPAAPEICLRNAATPPQRGLTAAERAQNLRGVFSIIDPAGLPARIAIVDDVVTTTATVNELASTLRQAGASRIEVWALARVNQS